MKAFIIQRSEVIYTFFLAVIIFVLPYSNSLSSLGTVLLGVFWLLSGNWQSKITLLKNNKPALFLISLYMLMLVSLLYSDHLAQGWHDVEKKLAILVFALVLGSISLSEQKQQLLLKFYVWSAVISAVWGLAGLYNLYVGEVAQEIIHDFSYYQWRLPYVINFLAPHWAMFAGGAAIVSFVKFEKSRAWLYLIFFLFLNIFIVLLASRMALGALWLIVLLYYAFEAIRKKKWYLIALPLAVLLIAGGIVWTSSPYLRGKLLESSGTSDRSYRWSSGFEAWLNSPVFGYGAGSGTPEVKRIFLSRNYPIEIANLEVHNQYLNFLVHFGLLGLAVFLAVICIALYYGWKKSNVLILLLIPFFCCTFFTESMLENHQGVLTFALLYSLVVCTPLNYAFRYKDSPGS